MASGFIPGVDYKGHSYATNSVFELRGNSTAANV